MKNRLNTKVHMLLDLTVIAVLFMVLPVHAGKPPRGGGSGGGLPYPTASTVRQLIEDINYANQTGGAITINLAPGAIFALTSVNNNTDGNNGLPVIGGTKGVNLTIIGNGATIERIAVIGRYSIVKNPFRLFDVAPGASLTLSQVTLKGGSAGAILNQGTLNVINGSTLSDNSGGSGGAIYNSGGTVTVSDSTLSHNHSSSGGGIYNNGGTVTIGHSALSNSALYYGGSIYNNSGTVTVSDSDVSGNSARYGGGLYNNGGTITLKDSAVNNNSANHYDYPWVGGYGGGIYNSAGRVVINHCTLTGNTADPGFENWFVVGGGIFNDVQGTVTVGNDSHIFGNYYDDVNNSGVLYLESTSTIGTLDGNPAISF